MSHLKPSYLGAILLLAAALMAAPFPTILTITAMLVLYKPWGRIIKVLKEDCDESKNP